jgi:hypothetical protein
VYETKEGQKDKMTGQPPMPSSPPFNRKWKACTALAIVLVLAGWGLYVLLASDNGTINQAVISRNAVTFAPTGAHPAMTATPGTVSGNTGDSPAAKITSDSITPTYPTQQAVTGSTATAGPMLGAVDSAASDTTLASNGFKAVVLNVNWSNIEPSEGSYSASTISSVQDEINSALAAGLSPSLDIGVQYAPSWIFGVGGGTQFVDQYGDVFTGSQSSGNYVPNAVTDMNVRTQLGEYINYLGTHLSGLGSVRLGGGAYNEMCYPSGEAGSKSDAYWFYDTSSQAILPASVQGWKPGTGSTSQAAAFMNAYNDALVNYGVWLEQIAASAFPSNVKLEMLLPGWGERPGDLQTAERNLLDDTPAEVNQGLDWTDLLPELPANGRVVVYTTYADATQGVADDPDPAAYIHNILPAGMLEGGESTGNGLSTSAGMNLEFTDAKNWNWYVANWFFGGQSQTPAQLESAFNGH